MIDSISKRCGRRGAGAVAGALLVAMLLLSGCAGVVVGGVAAGGVAAYDERGLDGVARDLRIAAAVSEAWILHDHALPAKVSLEVWEGRVMITGAVDDPKVQADAVRLAWQVEGVKDVINEVRIMGAGGAIGLGRDSWITTQLRSKLTFDKEIYAINYAVETVNGTVYLIGIAQNQDEMDRVLAHARTIDYVRNVINHVRVKGRT